MSLSQARPSSKPERLAYWYFRLNGFTTIEDFVVHPDRGTETRTDVDILAVRFLYRRENVDLPMEDDPRVADCPACANIILAEIKTGYCSLNGPWTNQRAGNMQRVLRAVGCVPNDKIELASESLYNDGKWSDDFAMVRLFSLGEQVVTDLHIGRDQQIEWSSVIDFCTQRFREYRPQKRSVGQWKPDGIALQRLSTRGDRSSAESSIRAYFGLHHS